MARSKSRQTGPVYYTTFQVAKYLGVSPPTVVNWVEGGFLKAHRTPGGHRRITKEDIVAFARERNYPLSADLPGITPTRGGSRVLIVDNEEDFCDTLKTFLEVKGSLEVEAVHDGFAAGLTIMRFRPHVIVMDLLMEGLDGFEAFKLIQENPDTRGIPVIACTGGDESLMERARRENFDGLVSKREGWDPIVKTVMDAISGRSGVYATRSDLRARAP